MATGENNIRPVVVSVMTRLGTAVEMVSVSSGSLSCMMMLTKEIGSFSASAMSFCINKACRHMDV